jgi:hypothetical protein
LVVCLAAFAVCCLSQLKEGVVAKPKAKTVAPVDDLDSLLRAAALRRLQVETTTKRPIKKRLANRSGKKHQ